MLLLVFLGSAIVLSTGPASAQGPEPVPISARPAMSSEELRNLTYPNNLAVDAAAPLTDGTYADLAAPGSAAQVTVQFQRAAFGAVDGEPAAAVVLATNGGGSGTFFDLHLVTRAADGTPRSVARRDLGDRIRLQGLAFAGEAVRIDFTGFAPTDPFCCPTLNLAHEFRLRDGDLELVRGQEAPALLAVPEGLSLAGVVRRAHNLSRDLGLGAVAGPYLGVRSER